MGNIVKGFDDFINEDLNFTMDDAGICRLESRWFYYNPEDDIIYGCETKPVGDDSLFAFNPSSCTIILNDKEKPYDVNNPMCLITYDLKEEIVKMYRDTEVLEYLKEQGFKDDRIDADSQECRSILLDMFENNEDVKHILIHGNQLVASSFDIIEEN